MIVRRCAITVANCVAAYRHPGALAFRLEPNRSGRGSPGVIVGYTAAASTRGFPQSGHRTTIVIKLQGNPRPQQLSETAPGLLEYRRIVVLTDGASRGGSAKTAISLLRYRTRDVIAVLDRSEQGGVSEQLFGVGGEIPVVGSLADAPTADAMFIGIAPAGGKLPAAWRAILLEAIALRMDIVSGLHEFLSNDPELVDAAQQSGARLIDVRKNNNRNVAERVEFPAHNLRVHTVGQDCSVGKMVVAMEVERELRVRGEDAQFLATGQTGIMIAGEGVPVDCVTADFISGAVEQLAVRHQHHATVLVEGQGSITHPSFSGVTLGLLHGCAPQGLILCYEAARHSVKELDHVLLTPLKQLLGLYESLASVRCPAKVIGVAVNSKRLSRDHAEKEVARVQQELGLPACDVYLHGAGVLADAVQRLRAEVIQ